MRNHHFAAARGWFLVTAIASFACAPDSTGTPEVDAGQPVFEKGPDAPKEGGGPSVQAIVSVTLSPASSTIAVGQTVLLTAVVINDAGQTLQNPQLTWTTNAIAVATVSATGLVTGVAGGTATITATAKNGVNGSATVIVTGPPPPPPTSETIIAAGDIAVCGTSGDEETANLIDNIPGTVVPLGDLAYPSGTTADFANCYDPTWGRHKARTRPVTGNHEYGTAGAAPYFAYFGSAAGDPTKGYYSYDLGDWHVVVLNSNCTIVACNAGSPQEVWLRADLAATTKPCILAIWHHPRWTSGAIHGNNGYVHPFWVALYQVRADVVLNAHAHHYERFGLQNPSAVADPQGIREFVVGTGGRSPMHNFGTIKANSQVRNNTTFGVLKLTLGAGTYTWDFVPISGQTWTDSGTGTCH